MWNVRSATREDHRWSINFTISYVSYVTTATMATPIESKNNIEVYLIMIFPGQHTLKFDKGTYYFIIHDYTALHLHYNVNCKESHMTRINESQMDMILRIFIDHLRVKLIELTFKWTYNLRVISRNCRKKFWNGHLVQPERKFPLWHNLVLFPCIVDAVQNRHDMQYFFVSHVLSVTHLPLLCHA